MPVSIIRDNAIAIIKMVLFAFDRHLSDLDDMKNSRPGYLMNSQAKELAEEYTQFHGAVSNSTGVGTSLEELNDEHLADMLYKCVLLADFYKLQVGSLPDLPEDEVDEIPFFVEGRYLTGPEKAIFIEILGTNYAGVLNNVVYYSRLVKEAEIRAATNGMAVRLSSTMPAGTGAYGISLPNAYIYIPTTARSSGNADEMKALLVHELFHQVQYIKFGAETAFSLLYSESSRGGQQYKYYLSTLSNSNSTVWDISTLEGQAQFVEDFANGYFKGMQIGGSNPFVPDVVKMAQILNNSGFTSTAINKVLHP
jgi:hypothetical protein